MIVNRNFPLYNNKTPEILTEEELIEKIKEGNMQCPICGCRYFNVTVETTTVVQNAEFSESFPNIYGSVSSQTSKVVSTKCKACGQELDTKELKKVTYCNWCGKPIREKFVYESEDGKVYHASCAYAVRDVELKWTT